MLASQIHGVSGGHHTQLFAIFIDDPDLGNPDTLVDAIFFSYALFLD
jgi:hypothetical protein